LTVVTPNFRPIVRGEVGGRAPHQITEPPRPKRVLPTNFTSMLSRSIICAD